VSLTPDGDTGTNEGMVADLMGELTADRILADGGRETVLEVARDELVSRRDIVYRELIFRYEAALERVTDWVGAPLETDPQLVLERAAMARTAWMSDAGSDQLPPGPAEAISGVKRAEHLRSDDKRQLGEAMLQTIDGIQQRTHYDIADAYLTELQQTLEEGHVICDQHEDITDDIRRIAASEVSGLKIAKPSQPIEVDGALYGLSVILASAMAISTTIAPQIQTWITQFYSNDPWMILYIGLAMLIGIVVLGLVRRLSPRKH
jgi:hypothetical protein